MACNSKCYTRCRGLCQDKSSKECHECYRKNAEYEMDPSKYIVILGQHEAGGWGTDGFRVGVCNISLPPPSQSLENLFDSGFDNDFSILWLTRPILLNDKVSPVCLPTPNMTEGFLLDKNLITSGWGGGSFVDGNNILMAVELPGVSNEICSIRNLELTDAWNPNITQNMLCAGYPDENKSICPGDSGGMIVEYLTNLDIFTLMFF